jgi:hypothetical protein
MDYHTATHVLQRVQTHFISAFLFFFLNIILIFSGSLRLPAALTGGNNFAIFGSAIVSISNTHALCLNFFEVTTYPLFWFFKD